MIGGRHSDASIRAARKKVNTLWLDFQQVCSTGFCMVACVCVLTVISMYFAYTIYYLSDHYVNDTKRLADEAEQLRSLVREQQEARKALQSQLDAAKSQLEMETSRALLIERRSQSTVADLEAGIGRLENENNRLLEQLDQLMGLVKGDGARNALPPPPVDLNERPPRSSSPTTTSPATGVGSGPGADLKRQAAVKDNNKRASQAMKHAWNGYVEYAWGKDELKPVSKSAQNWLNMGLTIVDALDTLWIMDMKDEFYKARDWVDASLHFDVGRDVSLFETCIRELGGLLSAFDLSGDRMFLEKSEDLALRLLRGFGSESGLPYATINLKTGAAKSPGWTSGASVLSEMGTLQMEFLYLAYHLNKPELSKQPMNVFKHLDSLEKDDGLYNLYVHPRTGQFQGKEVSLGALGDSFYEYQLKLWLLTNKQAEGYRRMFDESMHGVLNRITFKTEPSGFTYIAQIGRNGNVDHRLEHLACFAGGMLALGSVTNPSEPRAEEYMETGAGVTETCHWAYNRTATGIGPEYIQIDKQRDFSVPSRGKHYLLRPETVESFFYMWRLTHDPKYREWGWQAFKAIEKHCKTDVGYSGIFDVNTLNPQKDDLQQSFFLAETLKYLYLLFSDDDLIPLDEYVFNTEAHPLSVIDEPIHNWPQELMFQLIVT